VTDSFFHEIEVDASPSNDSVESLQASFEEQIRESLNSSADDRARRLAEADGRAKRVQITAFAFIRNADVVAEVLLRARGHCERCRRPAPFRRKSDQSPYLEVHHRVPLAAGGPDIVANAEALCPNCHREAHHGDA
jgi:5-methylcytosine-specific restriction endonuclease McrA